MGKIYNDEIREFLNENNLNFLMNNSIGITGASGLLGSYMIDVLMEYNNLNDNSIKVYAIVRNQEKARTIFEKYLENNSFVIVQQDMNNPITFNVKMDYIIHAASNSNPSSISNDPIGTIKSNVLGTINLFEYARLKKTKRIIYISSSEVYGECIDDSGVFNETSLGLVDQLKPRSSYSESKRMGENICVNYSNKYDINTSIVRICFAYGSTFSKSDNRVIPQFLRMAVNGNNIVLKSNGKMMRSYAYLYDVISGIMTILRNGVNGEVYNISNKDSNISIKSIAEIIAKATNTTIEFDIPNGNLKQGYSAFSKSLLSETKLRSLGWRPKYDMKEGLLQTIEIIKENGFD